MECSDSEKLRLLACWFHGRDYEESINNNEVQQNLIRIANTMDNQSLVSSVIDKLLFMFFVGLILACIDVVIIDLEFSRFLIDLLQYWIKLNASGI